MSSEDIKQRKKDYAKQYREEHKKYFKDYWGKYYEDNKKYIYEKTECECGCMISKKHMQRHKNTTKHINKMKLKHTDTY